MRQVELAERLCARPDRYAQLLGEGFAHRLEGMELRSSSALSDEEREELESLAPAAFDAYREEGEELVGSLRELVAQADPLHVLGVIKAANLLAVHGSYYEPTHRGLESSIELVAGLLITQPPSAERQPADAELLREITAHLARLQDVMLLRNFAAPRGDDPTAADLRFTGAMHWMSARGTSYEHHGAELARAIHGPYDELCRKRYGFTVDDALRVGHAEETWSTKHFNELLTQAQEVADDLRAKSRDPVSRAMLGPDALAHLDEPGTVDRFASAAFQYVLEQRTAEATVFTVDDLVDDDLPREMIEAVLSELSVSVGELEPDAYKGPFDRSPLIERPFVEFEGRYVLAVPGMVLRDTLSLFESRLLRVARNFSRARAKTLDALAVQYLAATLPGSRSFTNLAYEGTELDGLVLFERMALVVEGKGKALSPAARRGDVRRLRSDLTEAVEDAWRQGKRAREYLLADAPAIFADERGADVLRLDPGSVDEVIIVNPTLHQLGGHASQLQRLRSLGLFAEGEYPWSVFINDLRIISETADNAAVFLHYLAWRARLPLGERLLVGDEIDLWSSYLLCDRFRGLNDGGHHTIGNASTDFDAYYYGVLGNGPPSPRPSKFLREPVKSFVARMVDERPSGWLQAASTCLELSLVEQAYAGQVSGPIGETARREREVIAEEAGRLRLVGIPRESALEDAIEQNEAVRSDATFHFYVRSTPGQAATIEWAKTVRPVSLELSDVEKRFLDELTDRQRDARDAGGLG